MKECDNSTRKIHMSSKNCAAPRTVSLSSTFDAIYIRSKYPAHHFHLKFPHPVYFAIDKRPPFTSVYNSA
jgi:hypothetical protein